MTTRRNYADDPGLCDRVFDLLQTWIPALRTMRDQAARWGADWRRASTPFVIEEGGEVVAHVGVLELTFVLDGEKRRCGGIHAVCTRADRRRTGLYRRVMEDALDWADARYETLVLSTADPYLYEPFDFRIRDEHGFALDVDHPGGGAGFQRVTTASEHAEHAEFLRATVDERTPVSLRAGVLRDFEVFAFNQAHVGVQAVPDLGIFAVSELRDRTWRLHDVVARDLPPLADLLAQVDQPVDRIEFGFCPDRFAPDAEPVERRDADDVFMVRGPFPVRGPFMIPLTARH